MYTIYTSPLTPLAPPQLIGSPMAVPLVVSGISRLYHRCDPCGLSTAGLPPSSIPPPAPHSGTSHGRRHGPRGKATTTRVQRDAWCGHPLESLVPWRWGRRGNAGRATDGDPSADVFLRAVRHGDGNLSGWIWFQKVRKLRLPAESSFTSQLSFTRVHTFG